jgi:KaiC/GvpD/RAD55 family RecA-like ATPase
VKISSSFIIDSACMHVTKAYDISRDFFLNLKYAQKDSIKPRLLVFKKRMSLQNDSSTEPKDYDVNLKVSFNPLENSQSYSNRLITVNFDYLVDTLGRESTSGDRKIFENEIEQLKSKLVGKISSKRTSIFGSAFIPPTENEEPSEKDQIAVNLARYENEFVSPKRISTGYKDLDNFLFGGLPEKYAVIITSPSNDEREILIKNFLRAGIDVGEVTFYLTLDSENGKSLAEEHPGDFYLFLSNPSANKSNTNLPNVFNLDGVSNLSNIDIALTKSLRRLESTSSGVKRICIDVISDVLLQHGSIVTRKWVSRLVSELKSKGFTILALINPLMHSPHEVQAILGLFDGEIEICEKETEDRVKNILRIKKMYNQQYLEGELIIKREKSES